MALDLPIMGRMKLGVPIQTEIVMHAARSSSFSELELAIEGMTCASCVKTITGAVNEAVPGAVVAVDLPTHRVTITGTDQADRVEAAIRDAGYEPARV